MSGRRLPALAALAAAALATAACLRDDRPAAGERDTVTVQPVAVPNPEPVPAPGEPVADTFPDEPPPGFPADDGPP
jgi:hypothetical protein